jgi:hypothetical protein
MRPERWVSNGVIAVSLVVLAVSLPPLGAVHGAAREWTRAQLSAFGVRLPEWKLFAPNVHKENVVLSAEVTLADGSTRRWTSPDFAERSFGRRFCEGQLPKFYDSLRRDKHSAAWRPFAAWVAREVAPGEGVTRVRLERTVSEIAAPGAESGRIVRHAFYERWFR